MLSMLYIFLLLALVTLVKFFKAEYVLQQMSEYWLRAISGFDVVFNHKAMLCGWISGPEAVYMEGLSEMQVGEDCTHLLRYFISKNVPSPKKVYR